MVKAKYMKLHTEVSGTRGEVQDPNEGADLGV